MNDLSKGKHVQYKMNYTQNGNTNAKSNCKTLVMAESMTHCDQFLIHL